MTQNILNDTNVQRLAPPPIQQTPKRSNQKVYNGKRKLRDEANWKKPKAKRLRGKGEQYLSPETKRIVPERKLRPIDPNQPCCKSKRCFENIPRRVQSIIRNQYYSLGETVLRRRYVVEMVHETSPKRHYGKNKDKQKQVTRQYRFKWNNRIPVNEVRLINTIHTSRIEKSGKL